MRESSLVVQRRSLFPVNPADVVEQSAEADILERLDVSEALVAPCPRELSGHNSVRGLGDDDHVVTFGSDQHHAFFHQPSDD
jgi:hypothetical protein